ncbi:DR2241 family protein [Halomicrobium urmianum]|uniref:DR2241 family protein n=1 Tax=Halomicrobium urmianum TaxID=1586233 RepID=UPI001CD9909E|nr:DR2241 family protein [Halomicrobium urmianum]
MHDSQVAAVTEAAADGIDFDGFEVRADGDEYRVAANGAETTVGEDDLDAALAEHVDYATNWYFWHATAPQAEPRWAYLRWLERSDELSVPERYDALREGVTRSWGQLRITATVDEGGQRRYALRNEEDADVPDEDLATYEDPLEARSLAKRDDDGKYRPLKTAPTLRTGWRFAGLSAEGLVQAVDFFYPATVANWYAEREGELDVDHWRETMERQTGMFGLVETWDRGEGHEHVNWVAEACCVDSQCLKRREWQYDDETDLDVDGGDGRFPCREPCSVVISAARQWTKLEAEEPRTYEFELTPSEKEQIEAIVDAVADGEAEEIREADVYEGANRYRARFLRAKLFDEDGNLAGVETDRE